MQFLSWIVAAAALSPVALGAPSKVVTTTGVSGITSTGKHMTLMGN
jgi:hypothetical protein